MSACNFYVDLRIHPWFFQAHQGQTPPVVAWVGRALGILHGAFSESEKAFPIAFPEYLVESTRQLGRTIRVFGATAEELESLVRSFRGHSWVQENVVVAEVKPVPAKVKYWAVFSRERWPHRRRSAEAYRALCERVERLPSVRMVSKSNGNPFVLAIAKSSAAWDKEVLGQLDGFGLSQKTAPVPVPCF